MLTTPAACSTHEHVHSCSSHWQAGAIRLSGLLPNIILNAFDMSQQALWDCPSQMDDSCGAGICSWTCIWRQMHPRCSTGPSMTGSCLGRPPGLPTPLRHTTHMPISSCTRYPAVYAVFYGPCKSAFKCFDNCNQVMECLISHFFA